MSRAIVAETASAVEKSTRGILTWGVSAAFHLLLLLVLRVVWVWVEQRTGPSGTTRPSASNQDLPSVAIVRVPSEPSASSATEAIDPAENTPEPSAQPDLSAQSSALPDASGAANASTELSPEFDLEARANAATKSPLAPLLGSAPGGSRPSGRLTAKSADAGTVEAVRAAEAERAAKSRPVGEAARVGLFGQTPVEGRSFVFLLDRSQSMGTDGLGVLEDARREVTQAIASLKPHHRFQVIAYNESTAMIGRRDWLTAEPKHQNLVTDFFDGIAAHGPTDHYLGLISALRLKPDVVFLVSDGADPVLSERRRKQLLDAAGGRTTIVCMLFCRGKLSDPEAARSLQTLSEATGGETYVFDLNAGGAGERPRTVE